MGSDVVEGIKLDYPKEELHLSAKAFSKLINQRLLKVSNVQLPEGLKYLSNELRLLEWHGYPLKSLPSNLQMDRIVELKMRSSSIEQLRQGMKAMSNPRMEFSIVVPGNEVPEWVKHKSEDSSIRITRPSHGYPRKLVGYVVCSVFVVHKHQPALSDAFGRHNLFFHLKADEKPSSTSHFIYFEDKFGEAVSGHLWLLYLSCHEYFDLEWHNEYKHIEFLFSSHWGAGLEVKRCGVCPIYEQELKELCQTLNQYSSSAFEDLNEYFVGLNYN
ncbi:uncharacterized protein LOC116129856 isoform X2 [Pistacia vera]|uniref:uncharacterized protein LOC116129856 isoform X2 n=1 Tax=Pistacia vera TaxID=55513 RepID=UPI001262DEBD|nr:uncharacterized protein LOC116129856 isoform X2 [Pistacia vera]